MWVGNYEFLSEGEFSYTDILIVNLQPNQLLKKTPQLYTPQIKQIETRNFFISNF